MTHVMGRLMLIVNPRAGRRSVRENLPALRTALDDAGLDHDVAETSGPGDATHLARKALQDGCRYLVAVGGDGTVHEVVNGMFTRNQGTPDTDGGAAPDEWEPVAPKAILAVASIGSGNDFIRTYGLDRKPEKLAAHFATHTILPTDVGVASYTDGDGQRTERLFANVASVGYPAEVVRKVSRMPRLLGRVRFLLGAYGGILAMRRRPFTAVHLAHADVDRHVVALAVCNGQFFGGGMKVAPRALPDDGRFNTLVFSGGASQLFLMTQQLHRGEHVPHPEISEYQTPTVSLDPDVPLGVEADGEYLGFTPVAFRLLPQALRLKI